MLSCGLTRPYSPSGDRWDAYSYRLAVLRTSHEELDLTRDPSGHVGFGMGLHQCVNTVRALASAPVRLRVARLERACA